MDHQRERLGRSIARAANWLDDYKPGWHNRIDFNRLNMSEGQSCICGQLGLDWQWGQKQVETETDVFRNQQEVEFWRFEVERRKLDETVTRPVPSETPEREVVPVQ
jgi:hypothetical protein